MIALLTLLKIAWYRLRLKWAERHETYVRESWLEERSRVRQLD